MIKVKLDKLLEDVMKVKPEAIQKARGQNYKTKNKKIR